MLSFGSPLRRARDADLSGECFVLQMRVKEVNDKEGALQESLKEAEQRAEALQGDVRMLRSSLEAQVRVNKQVMLRKQEIEWQLMTAMASKEGSHELGDMQHLPRVDAGDPDLGEPTEGTAQAPEAQEQCQGPCLPENGGEADVCCSTRSPERGTPQHEEHKAANQRTPCTEDPSAAFSPEIPRASRGRVPAAVVRTSAHGPGL
uniref:Uncharacterized protein n=1 Tax=Tetraselmis sp. GSL018 TaxID=582737 RepID=A0A061RXS0_9CHLO